MGSQLLVSVRNTSMRAIEITRYRLDDSPSTGRSKMRTKDRAMQRFWHAAAAVDAGPKVVIFRVIRVSGKMLC
jgi:hypothetical protein